ncbi:MAG TPA: MEDS domain-containing protein [Longimicrobium sp.]|jgi:hypothetical protein|nr:MEDS domain-containing protein [Longimicrobium sp.]
MSAAPIPFAGSTLGRYRHVCAFFNTPDDEYRTLLPFIRDGLERGERAFHVLDPENREPHLARLREAGIDVDAAQGSGQLEVRVPAETYLRGGCFDKDAMLALVQEVLQAGLARGFPLTRLVAHAECVLDDWPGSEDWVEYETRLNHVLPRYDDPVICTYDLNRLDAATAMDVMRTHPVVIVGGLLQENPFYVSPDEFLRELDERKGRPAAPAAGR